jgi:hypothetical protein
MMEDGSGILAKNASGTLTFRDQADSTDLTMGNAPRSHTHTLSNVSDVTATKDEVNVLDGITATTTELNYTDGVTSAIQTQLDGKSTNTHSSADHSGATGNLLAGITPTFSNWSVNPGTNADLVSELMTGNMTTNGIGQAGTNTITYDLGSSKRCIIYAHAYNNTAVAGYIDVSDASDFSTVESVIYNFPTGHYEKVGIAKFRYIRYRSTGAHTLSEFRLRVYQIN